MARPKKNNADYFSHDADMRNHRKMKAIRAKFGLEGYAIWNMVLEVLSNAELFIVCHNQGVELIPKNILHILY